MKHEKFREAFEAPLQKYLETISQYSEPLGSEAAHAICASMKDFSQKRLMLLAEWFENAPVRVYATGSYARNMPAPYSDLDLLFLLPEEVNAVSLESWVEEKVYPLYEFFPKVTHAFRKYSTLSGVVSGDYRVYFGLSDARSLKDGKPFNLPAGITMPREELLMQMRRRWDRYGQSPCLVDLNVKESPGAIMDHLIAMRLDEKKDGEGLKALAALRAHLHLFARKANDVTSGPILRGFSEEDRARLYGATIQCAQSLQKLLDPDLSSHPIRTLAEWLEASKSSKRQFNFSYIQGDFNELFPEMKKQLLRCSDSLVHKYTVGWHSSECLKAAKDLIANVIVPIPMHLDEAFREIHRVELLYLAVFLHDVGKGHEGDHSDWGADWVRRSLNKDLSSEDVELVAWLIQNHLELHARAMKEDLLSEKTMEKACAWAVNPRHLSYLYVLTIADLYSTNRSLWSQWRMQMLGNYFSRLMTALRGVCLVPARQVAKNQAQGGMNLPQEYSLLRDRPGQLADEKLLTQAKQSGFAMDIMLDASVGFDVLSVAINRDITGVLARLVERLFEQRMGVWRTRTYWYGEGFLDLLWLYPYDGAVVHLSDQRRKAVLRVLQKTIEEVLLQPPKRHAADFNQLKKFLEDVAQEGNVQVQPSDEENQWNVFVRCRDREGLLKDLMNAIFQSGYNTLSARIGTTGDFAVDSFVVSPN